MSVKQIGFFLLVPALALLLGSCGSTVEEDKATPAGETETTESGAGDELPGAGKDQLDTEPAETTAKEELETDMTTAPPEPDRPADEPKKDEPATDARAALLDPSLANEQAPAQYRIKMDTTKGPFVIEVTRAWSPRGADRFYNLVKIGYFEDIAFFRVIDGFMAQFGISGDPRVNEAWRAANIQDDPVQESNLRGYISFATAGPNTRSNQFFINLVDNVSLDRMGFSPFGKVVEGMEVVDSIYSGYGEGAPRGKGPSQMQAQTQGNEYLKAQFPNLDFIESATHVD
jgi:peptidyl-prolyl cis-trans isomerase A (cyclophilin A)